MTTTSDISQGEIQLVDASKKLLSGGEIVVVKPAAFIEFFRSQMEPPSSPIGTRTNPRKSWIHNINSNHEKSINLDRTMLSRSVHSKHYTVSNITCLNDNAVKKNIVRPNKKKKARGWLCQQLGLMSKCERMENFLNLSDEELKQVRRKQEVAMLRQEAKFNKVFHSYLKVMKGKEGIVKEMNDLVDVADQKRKRKQALMYEQWTLQVFYGIRQQLQEKLDKMSPDYIKEKLRRFHYQYMDASNYQLIYRDMIFQDYNPFESLQYVIKYSTKGLYDPTMHDLQKEVFEKKFLGEAVKESSAREILDITKWTYRAFRSTVWGHINADEEDGSEIVVQDLEKWRSHDLMYNTTFLASKYWREEFPRGKMERGKEMTNIGDYEGVSNHFASKGICFVQR